MKLIIILFTLGNIPSAIFSIITSADLRSKNWFEVKTIILYVYIKSLCKIVLTKLHNTCHFNLGAQSRTSNRKAWFRYPASLVRKFWEM